MLKIISLLAAGSLFIQITDAQAQTVFGGVGLGLAKTNDALLVTSVVPASPAESAGIPVGAKIVSINEVPTAGMTLVEVVKLIRGPVGSTVTLEVAVNGAAHDVSLKRADIAALMSGGPPIKYRMLNEQVGLLAIPGFGTNASSSAIADALGVLSNQGARHLVIDLRGNAGGSLNDIADVAELFIGKMPLWEVRRNGQANDRVTFGKRDALWHGDVIVLVNGHTYSGAEMLASAFQTSGRASIWGEPTTGHTALHSLITQADGSQKIVETGELLTATGKSLRGSGVKPDVTVENLPDDEIFSRAMAFFKKER